MQPFDTKKNSITVGTDARKKAGYPEALKEIMLLMSWEMGVVISTRVGNPPRIDIPVKESTKASDIKTKTAPSTKTENDLHLISPARGTIIVDQEIFGKTGSARVTEGQGYNQIPYPTTLRELLKFSEQGLLEANRIGDEIHFEALGNFKPVANGYYDHDKLKFTPSDQPISLTYSIKLSDLNESKIADVFDVALSDQEKKKLSPWADSNKLEPQSQIFLQENDIDNAFLDKPIPLSYRHGQMQDFKVLNVVAKDNAIVIGDDDTLSMSPTIEFLKFIKIKHPQNPAIIHELMDTMGDFNKQPLETAKRLIMIEKLLCEFNIERLSAYPNRYKDMEHWAQKLAAINSLENPEEFYLNKYFKSDKFAGIDSCGKDGMSAFELLISITINEKFSSELKHIGQFIQHPPEIRNHTVPSSLEDKAMHIWNGRFVLTNDENGLIAFYAQHNEGDTYAERFPLLAEHFVEVSPLWFTRESKNEQGELKLGADKWWPIIAIQIALEQEDLIDRATLAAYYNYITNKPELSNLDNKARATAAENILTAQVNISELSDLLNPNDLSPGRSPSTPPTSPATTPRLSANAVRSVYQASKNLLLFKTNKGDGKVSPSPRVAANDNEIPNKSTFRK